MDNLNLHNRLKDELGSENEIFYYSTKSILKLIVELQCLVAKCFKTRKILPYEVCKFCVFLYYAWKKLPFSRQLQLKNGNFFRV